MTRFLLDMGIAQSTGRYLTSRGHDVVHLSEQGLKRLPDDRVVAKAKDEERDGATYTLPHLFACQKLGRSEGLGHIPGAPGAAVVTSLRLIEPSPSPPTESARG